MRGIWVDTNGTATKGFSELASRMRDQQKEVRGGIVSDGQGPLEADESRINEDAEVINKGHIELLPVQVQVKAKAQAQAQDQAVLQRQQEQPPGPQGSVVRWEQFLPRRSLKVLLVENDDSTRHVVNALLRNCSYEERRGKRDERREATPMGDGDANGRYRCRRNREKKKKKKNIGGWWLVPGTSSQFTVMKTDRETA